MKFKSTNLLSLVSLAFLLTMPANGQSNAVSNAGISTEQAKGISEEKEPAEVSLEENAEANAFASASEFNLVELLLSDIAMIPLLIMAILAIAIGIERAWLFYKTGSNNSELVVLLTEKLKENPETGLEVGKIARDKQFGVEGRIASVALQGWEHGEETMKEYANAAITAERRSLSQRLPILSTVGNNAPFVGLLGTVIGILNAFAALAQAADAGPQVVMKGISHALYATAGGLAVAIPAVILFNIFSTIIKKKMSHAEEIVGIISAIRMATMGKGKLPALLPGAQPLNAVPAKEEL
jgi:biopolymer transport protein ExbB